MKAGVLYGNGDIRYADWTEPRTGPGEIKIKVHVCGICGSDIPRIWNSSAHFYPIVLGHEFAGAVFEIGEGVTKCKVGDRVTAAPLKACMICDDCQKGNYAHCKKYSFIGSREQGALAEYIVVPERNVVKLSNELSYDFGAFFEPATVSLHGLFNANFQGGSDVAVIGAGNIGILMVEWLKAFGAKHITTFDIDDKRLATAKRFGADQVINLTNYQNADDILKGKRFQYVFELAGQPETIQLGYQIVSNSGMFVCIGTPSKSVNFEWNKWEQINRKEFNLTGTWMSYSAPFPGKEWDTTAFFFGSGALRIDEDMIFKRIPLSEIQRAAELLRNPRDIKGKILITID